MNWLNWLMFCCVAFWIPLVGAQDVISWPDGVKLVKAGNSQFQVRMSG